ncbi:isocitrate lyase/phosphoenolpyruvate mutase family protein [Paenibacillus alvei]|uniref:Phosphoenolpyruvate phosphomutase n=1 Tax=Paenibacillus alvei TaxID=44250 RepID=A0AAP7A1Q7_PAEAL|nr:isocitrate lyase/phosphoenolpyruvate mutase family protein [Paenibacillus alvei]NOJ73796.1 phosphoenolpyruvate phosphomutase [Paenibacillus alvei]
MVKETKAKQLRKMLKGDKLILVAGAHDGLSAKLAERNGFHAIWASGLGISAVQTVPDASILTMTEFLQAALVMNEACDLPIIADCDSGYGNVHNIVRMVEKYESAGIAGVCIEDKVYPKLNSFDNREQKLVLIEDFCAKIRAAKATKQDPDFVLIARVEALIAGLGQDEAQKRARAYAVAGADAILIHSKQKTVDEIAEFIRRWDLDVPIVLVPTKYPDITFADLERMGVRMSIYANQALRVSVSAIDNVLKRIVEAGSTKDIEGEIASVEEIFELQGVPEMKLKELEFYHEKTISS